MGRHYPTKGHFEHRPLYEELAEEFCRRITVGRWPVGRPLKTEAMIAAELGVSLGTVRRAFDRLEGMNLIDRTPGRGTIVRELDCERRLASLTNVVDLNGTPVNGDIEIVDAAIVRADETVATELGIDLGAPVVRVERVRSHLGRVFSVETAHHLTDGDEVPATDVLWASARNFIVAGAIAVKRKEEVRAVAHSDVGRIARFEGRTDPVLVVHRTLMAFDDAPLEFCVAHCQLGRDLRYRIC